jgi:hypothetical protein
LFKPPALAGPFGTPLTPAVPAPADPALGDPAALLVPAVGPLAAPPAAAPLDTPLADAPPADPPPDDPPHASADLAILDVNLNGEETYPLADSLAARAIPFIFATGYGSSGIKPEWSGVPVLQKAFQARELAKAIDLAIPR